MNEWTILLMTTISLAVFHTLIGPDHYLPFIALSRSGNWSMKKTLFITILSGFAHVMSSVILGFVAIGLGAALHQLKLIESFRGEIASWLLISFGLIYLVWSVRKFFKDRRGENSLKENQADNKTKSGWTGWIIFILFVLGPCETLIPVMLTPLIKNQFNTVLLAAGVYGFFTLITMASIVFFSLTTLKQLKFHLFDRFGHLLTGLVLVLSGAAVKLLGV